MRRWLRVPVDFWVASITLGIVAVELGMREYFHQLSTEAVRIVALSVVWASLAILFAVGRLNALETWRHHLGRFAVLVAGLVSLYILVWPDVSADIRGSRAPLWAAGAGIVMLLGLSWAMRTSDTRWHRFRWSLALGCGLFVGSQVLAGKLFARTIAWPPVGTQVPQSTVPSRSATVFLLLDELNARSAGPFVDVLEKAGLPVSWKAIQPAAGATAQVIPALLLGKKFDRAKPCGLTIICSGSTAVDFSMVTASHPRVDVVGFYMPYCAIQGLRYCVRLSPRPALSDPNRWRCGVLRRLQPADMPAPQDCLGLQSQRWGAFVDDVESAIWRAPLWEQGGMMYAHVPLPHPPGPTVGASLTTHYRENVQRALKLVNEMVERSKRNGIELTFVIFSDHPLRPALWCGEHSYAKDGCPVPPEFVDSQVPLIVAGKSRPGIASIEGNELVFSLTPR